jgi:hypothetical protein
MRRSGDIFVPDEPRKSFIQDWGPFLAFCGIGTYVFVRALGPLGFIPFYGTLLLFGFILWLPGAIRYPGTKRKLLDAVVGLSHRERREFMARLPARLRRDVRRGRAKRRITSRCSGPSRR